MYEDIGLGLDAAGVWGFTEDPYIGNFGDNALLYFHQYQNAPAGTPLADKAKTGTNINAQNGDPEALLADFRRDVSSGRLPEVSWIVAPEAYTEHPNWEPDFGAWYVSQVVDILASNPEVWSKMALFVTYDEDGGFFDHLVSPTPPSSRAQGLSTVPVTNEIFPGSPDHPAGPYGLGVRVPMIVVSPWSRGGWVNSQLFDHTSLIRFLEARFAHRRAGLVESNITPWRRAVVGDLTTAFDFKTPNAVRAALPGTDAFKPEDLVRPPDETPVPPADPQLPGQERGVRPARAIPYTLQVDGRAAAASFRIDFANPGRAAAVFQVRSAGTVSAGTVSAGTVSAGTVSADTVEDPRTYTVEPGKRLTDTWNVASIFDLSVFGPNGFFRRFRGGDQADLDVRASYGHDEIRLEITNRDHQRASVSVRDRYTSRATKLSLMPGEAAKAEWQVSRSRGWYDLAITVGGDTGFEYRYSGHLENGKDSTSDPGMGGLV